VVYESRSGIAQSNSIGDRTLIPRLSLTNVKSVTGGAIADNPHIFAQCAGHASLTSQAKRTGKSLASNFVIGQAPLLPVINPATALRLCCQAEGPNPGPVTT
jgi:hypothetical protein